MLPRRIRRSLARKLQDVYGYAQIAHGMDTGAFDLRADRLLGRVTAYVSATDHAENFNRELESALDDPDIEDAFPTPRPLHFISPDELTDDYHLSRVALGLMDAVRERAEDLQIDPATGELLD